MKREPGKGQAGASGVGGEYIHTGLKEWRGVGVCVGCVGGSTVCCVWSRGRVTHLLSPVGALVNLVSDVRKGAFHFLRKRFLAKTRS